MVIIIINIRCFQYCINHDKYQNARIVNTKEQNHVPSVDILDLQSFVPVQQ